MNDLLNAAVPHMFSRRVTLITSSDIESSILVEANENSRIQLLEREDGSQYECVLYNKSSEDETTASGQIFRYGNVIAAVLFSFKRDW